MKRSSTFSRMSRAWARAAGHPASFAAALSIIVLWACTGPLFHFSDTWQLVINTGTTIITFLMVFLIQNTQNRDSEAMQLKLDELLRATEWAHNGLLDIEELTEEDLDRLKVGYAELARKAREDLRRGLRDTGTPNVTQPKPTRPD
jgi:low affinity Fe/Cu permease